ncbi:FHA domain-containing protein PS1 isoform X1 [Gossypium hirsutum]|uniref:FHA domain-containing protein PS1 isoform X1 n=1 Tax=Gossypium hirsutum TaxID=3635 RepID=A0ABM2YRI4_GOSHI|nr:FHA domain-containing protein PS1 isoform X1 [Gossypium hirsutum]
MGEEKEMKIPVFTVVKNGAILKNIFVINKSRYMEDGEESETPEEVLIVGRHPDCNIMLTHPSISRFHLQIHSRPTSLKLSVLDLSSVHGTWVSGKKIDPGLAVELNEGDTIKLGGSTRVYKLHWIPMSRAYDMENPYVSAMDVPMEEEKEEVAVNTLSPKSEGGEEKDSLPVENKEEETSQSSVPGEEEELLSMDCILEGLAFLFGDGSSGVLVKKEIPSAPPMPENMNSSIYDDDDDDDDDDDVEKTRGEISELAGELSLDVESQYQKLGENSKTIFPEAVAKAISVSEGENSERYSDTENMHPSVVKEVENRRSIQESQLHLIEPTLDEEDILLINVMDCDEESQIPKPLSALKPTEERNLNGKFEEPEDYESENKSFCSASLLKEVVNSPLPTAPALLSSEYENLDSSPLRLETKPNLQSIWSRRGKPASVLQIQTGRSAGKAGAENKPNPKSLFVSSDEKEIFTPDKENFTPNTLSMKALKRKGKLEEDMMIASDTESQTPKLIKEQKSTRKASRNQQDIMIKGIAERAPFQSLMVDSAGKSTASNSKKIEKRIACPSLNKSAGEPRRTWSLIADTTSLLDKESRKTLKLLQGLKGTRLIIPRMVIRELDYLKRRGSLFRRTTEASSVLEWIEECMVKTKWWIHVQSTMEEGGPIAPTPPATPHSHFSEGSMGNSFGPFSAGGSLMKIATPTAEDHILDYALLWRKMKSDDGQLVVLSNDVTLKIKAMAEAAILQGLMCETVQEFRESVVNPFSERFMWADSSPRGHTWSVMDDVVLRDKYNRCPLKKPSKGGDIKGLKLILLHNSHYSHLNSFR